MTLDEKNEYIENYVREVAANVNYKYAVDVISEARIKEVLNDYYNSQEDLETEIIPKINNYIQQIVDNFLEQLKKLNEEDKNKSGSSFNSDYGSENNNNNNNQKENKLSSLMVMALSLVNCSTIEEINEFIDSVPNLYMISPIPKANYNRELIEAIKKNIFKIFQSTMLSMEAFKIIEHNSKEDAIRYSLHKQLSGLNLSIEEELKLGDIKLLDGLQNFYKRIEQICIEKFGKEEGFKVLNKVVNYCTTDFEGFNFTTYDQLKLVNEKMKADIQDCNQTGNDFQLVISSLKNNNVINHMDNPKINQNSVEKTISSNKINHNKDDIVKLECIKNDLKDYNTWKQSKEQSISKKGEINQLFQQNSQAVTKKEAHLENTQVSKPKAKTFTKKASNNSVSNKGFSNIITLSLIITFLGGSLLLLIYLITK